MFLTHAHTAPADTGALCSSSCVSARLSLLCAPSFPRCQLLSCPLVHYSPPPFIDRHLVFTSFFANLISEGRVGVVFCFVRFFFTGWSGLVTGLFASSCSLKSHLGFVCVSSVFTKPVTAQKKSQKPNRGRPQGLSRTDNSEVLFIRNKLRLTGTLWWGRRNLQEKSRQTEVYVSLRTGPRCQVTVYITVGSMPGVQYYTGLRWVNKV